MLVSRHRVIRDKVIKNLLFAHRRIAVSGNAVDLIRLSRYLLRLADKGEDVLIDAALVDDQ